MQKAKKTKKIITKDSGVRLLSKRVMSGLKNKVFIFVSFKSK